MSVHRLAVRNFLDGPRLTPADLAMVSSCVTTTTQGLVRCPR